MQLFGLKISRSATVTKQTSYSGVGNGGWLSVIRESFAGAWQRNVEVHSPGTLLAFSAVFSCVTGIAADIGKMPVAQYRRNGKIWDAVVGGELDQLMRAPNHFQNRIQFFTYWVVAKLLWGNAYFLKRRDERGRVVKLYPIDPRRVRVLVGTSGDVFYEIAGTELLGLDDTTLSVPAREVIHDKMVALFNPLCGVSPIYACGMAGTMGNTIQQNSLNFFSNMSRPSGMLSAPGEISDTTATRLKTYWEDNYSGGNLGRLAVLGDGLKYEAMTIPAVDAQLIEQLKWSVEDVARAFHYPLYKLGGTPPTYNNIEALNQTYNNDCLQPLIEPMELLLTEGLSLPEGDVVELDPDSLLRMDSVTRYERHNKAIAGGWLAPNQARVAENMPEVVGGDSPMMQQQNWSLAQLAERTAPSDASSVAAPSSDTPSEQEPNNDDTPSEQEPNNDDEEMARQSTDLLVAAFCDEMLKGVQNVGQR